MAEGLTPLEAYDQVMRFAARRGEAALRLAMHAAMPQVLRPELVHLVRLNFVPESLDDTSLEADVLFAPFCDDLGNGYYRFDANARQRLLVHLDPTYAEHAMLRSQQVAGFLLAYFDDHEHRVTSSQDPVYESFLEVERWVALAFLDPDAAAAQLAAVVREACAPEDVAATFRIAGLTSALSTPLARHHALLTYTAGVELLQRGDVAGARDLLEALGDREIDVKGITLPAPSTILRAPEPREAESAKTADEPASSEAPAGHLAPASYEFYVCCARTDVSPYLKQFVADLSEEVRQRIAARPDQPVAFLDQSRRSGMESAAATLGALSVTKLVLAVLSPAFFQSDVCARELGFFAHRLDQAYRPPPALIKPILWAPTPESAVPAVFRNMETTIGDRHADYNLEGLQFFLWKRPERGAEYQSAVDTLAAEIVATSREFPLPPMDDPPALQDVAPFWPASRTPQTAGEQAVPAAQPGRGGIHISYRRSDSAAYAGRLADNLSRAFTPDRIAMDVPHVDDDFRSVIGERVRSSSVVLVIIGRSWLNDRDEQGRRHLDDPNDLVRMEVAAAFEFGVPVIPVLVGGASMPHGEMLPPDVAPLERRNAIQLRDDSWRDDVDRLVKAIEHMEARAREPEPMRPMSRRIFLSGTHTEVIEFRQAVVEALKRFGHVLVTMDDVYTATSPPRESSRESLEKCDAMVLILGRHYGYVPPENNPDGLSITELEFRIARERAIPVFAFLAGDPRSARGTEEADKRKREKLVRFRAAVEQSGIPAYFGTPSSLAREVSRAIERWNGGAPGDAERANAGQQPDADAALHGPVLIFAGHNIDPPGLRSPRFPADKERVAREAIKNAVEKEMKRHGKIACAMASGTDGGDILFHEVCLELGIETRVYLPVPAGEFAASAFGLGTAPGEWRRRFTRVATAERVRLTEGAAAGAPDWSGNVEAMFADARQIGDADVTLIVLWDRRPSGSRGGVSDFVERAQKAGVSVEIIPSGMLFGFDLP